MRFYPIKFKEGERLDNFDLVHKLYSDLDFSSFIARDVRNNLRLQIEIPHTEIGVQKLIERSNVLANSANNGFIRQTLASGSLSVYNSILPLELLPPTSLKDLCKERKLSSERVGEIVTQILTAAEQLMAENIALPDISINSVYFTGSRIVIDYVKSVEKQEFLKKFAKIIVKISEDDQLAKQLIEQFPINEPDYDFFNTKSRIISILGKSASGKYLPVSNVTVKCPGCGNEYVVSAGVCKPCNINLLTGMPIEDDSKKKKKKRKSKEEKNFSWLVVLSVLIAIFAVFSKVLGISWILWTIFLGVSFALLVVIFIALIGT